MAKPRSKPTVLFVPGFWEGPQPFHAVSNLLEKAGYQTACAPLLSTGKPTQDPPITLNDDVSAIRGVVKGLVEKEEEVIVVGHSAGAFLGSAAIKGLVADRAEDAGKRKGGVIMLVFVAGAIWEQGYKHQPLPFFDFQGDRMYCASPRTLLFSDILSDSAAASQTAALSCQPASGWDAVIEYAGWKDVDSAYLVCEEDALLPATMQRDMAKLAGCKVVGSCAAGHMVPVSRPETVADFVDKVCGGL